MRQETQSGLPVIRMGMPLPSGRLLQYGIDSGLPLMFSANAFARYKDGEFRGFRLDAAAAIPAHVDAALDSAGFTAASQFGDYRFTIDEYLDLVAARPSWAFYSAMDHCVEATVAPDAAMRRLRIDATVASYWRCAERAAARGMSLPCPVVQGFYAGEYARCAEELGVDCNTPLVGLGSVCRRHLRGPDGLLAILGALDQVLPPGCQVHAFGVKGAGTLGVLLKEFPGRIASVDSMAYDFAVRRAMPVGRNQEMRALAMIEWHQRETRQLGLARPQPHIVGDRDRDRSAEEIAAEAVGKAMGELVRSNDLSYRDARHVMSQDAIVVECMLRAEGVHAFRDEEPDDDRGLGVVYLEVRDALLNAGLLPA